MLSKEDLVRMFRKFIFRVSEKTEEFAVCPPPLDLVLVWLKSPKDSSAVRRRDLIERRRTDGLEE